MAASSRGQRVILTASRLAAAPRLAPRFPVRRHPASIRPYSAAATADSTTSTTATPPRTPPTQPAASDKGPRYLIKGGIILTRPPLLTRPQTSFESAYFFYQKRLNERLTLPFTQSAFFKRDTPPQLDWAIKLRERNGVVAREVGQYNGRSSTAWDDEVRVGDNVSDPELLREILLKDAEARVSEDAEEIPLEERVPVERPQPRVTQADKSGDVKRLDRQLERTLYLVVQGEEGKWEFPTAPVSTDEALHDTARRALDDTAGLNMNTWIVGRVPVAHLVTKPKYAEDGTETERGVKSFFLKGRIMAGQANLEGNPFGYKDFKWLTRDELKETLAPEYFRGVRNMMAER
ncbi:related to MRPL17 - mitochondrial ribosomal protein, large subunit [Cephalotrichum gorgonifer]|uniref:Large ribosomal subunit protein mL46 n=1 Tax=Cephalotrichum gorgonifer TaxID=2041049 RepID=A0AAE8STW4_9PEZI|nr:related to MRPL17 - mitochondrial ribosomal protein, large subunit [Cephalotrichum gorgonifer]